MRTVARGFMLAGIVSLSSAAHAQYKSVGPDGRVTYGDQPPPSNARVLQERKLPAEGTADPALPFELQQAATKYPVTLYTGEKCGPCDEGRAYLRNRGIPFAERTVTSNDDIALFRQMSPDGTAPVVTVGSRKSIGFTQVGWNGLLDSAGYPATATLPQGYRAAVPTPLSPTSAAAPEQAARRSATTPEAQPAATPPFDEGTGPAGFRF